MPVAAEIAAGGGVLLVCAVLHIAILVWIARTSRPPLNPADRRFVSHNFREVIRLFLIVALSHTVQVCIWAGMLLVVGALPVVEESIYFAMVTYTTLGYGDIVLMPEFRIFGTMAAMTGILCFGLSTALLVGYFATILAIRK